jgi:hypothetical protein
MLRGLGVNWAPVFYFLVVVGGMIVLGYWASRRRH